MSKLEEKLVSWLFETKAIKVCPQDKPFWYTSGTIGPYYVNTQYLYGSEKKSEELLSVIDVEKHDKLTCSDRIFKMTLKNYNNENIYKSLIDGMVSFIRENLDLNEIDYISGGERRDWFFSLIIADLLHKPHITMFKDLSSVHYYKGESQYVTELKGKKLLHIADIITEASSYTKQWIPAAQRIGSEIKWSFVVVDRLQGGAENLKASGVKSYALVEMDKKLFDKAHSIGLLNKEQHIMVMNYMDNPKESMRKFLIEKPKFLEDALKDESKISQRAKLCINNDIYNLKSV